MLILFSCSDSEEEAQKLFLRIPDSSKSLEYTQKMQSANISIETNYKDWTIQSDRTDWCTVERIPSNSQMFIITLKENESTDIREATLTIKIPEQTETIKVRQLGTAPAILLNPETLNNISSTASEFELKITTNLPEYEIVIPESFKEWISVRDGINTRAMVTYNHTLRIENNPLTEPRQGSLVVKAKNMAEPAVTLNILQKKRSTDASDVVVDGDIKIVPTGGKDNQHHSGQGIENTYDGKINEGNPFHSPWSTDNPGTEFPVTLEYEFDGKEDIDYIIYYPNGGNGNFGKFKLYTANQADTEYQAAGEYDFKESGNVNKITLSKPLLKATRIKFEILSGAGGFASCSEMEFYRKNLDKPINRQLLSVFTDLTCCEVRADATEKDIMALPGFFANLAQQLKNGNISEWEQSFRIRDYEPYSDVEEWAEKLMTKRYGNLDNVTGIYANKGDEVILLVGDTHGHSIAVQCIYDQKSGDAIQTVSSGDMYFLEEGVNKIEIRHDGMLFIMYTADPSEEPIRVHIPLGSGNVSGFFDLEEHKTDAKYAELLSKATYKYFCVRGEKIMFYFHTDKLREFVRNEILSAIHLWDNIIGWEQELMGIEDVRPHKVNNHMFAISPEGGYMWASNYQIGFAYDYLGNILLYDNVMAKEDNAWGPAHEIGHVHQEAINWPGSTESSNNLFSNYVIYKLGKYYSRGRGLCKVAKARHADKCAWWNMGEATHQNEDTEVHMRMNWQLWNYYHRCGVKADFWQILFKLLRENANRVPESDPGRKQMVFAKLACRAANADLTEFFDQWGFFVPVNTQIEQYGTFNYVVTDAMINEAKEYMSQFPKPAHALQYIEDRKNEDFESDDYRSYESGDVGHYSQFKSNMRITKSPSYSLSGRRVQVTDGEQAVAFEWRKSSATGEILYFANTFTFDIPDSITMDDAKLYAVQADGKRIEMELK